MGAKSPANSLARMVFSTDLGWMGLLLSSAGVRKLTFHQPSAARAKAVVSAGIEDPVEDAAPDHAWVRLLSDYAAGRPVDLAGIPLDLDPTTDFQAKVVAHCRRIPFGQTLSYGQLAQRAGSPRAARAVGNIMKSNQIPLLVPCHRVLASGGKIGGYSAPGGLSLKERLLALEAGKAPVGSRRSAK